jgi:hypothetical protein
MIRPFVRAIALNRPVKNTRTWQGRLRSGHDMFYRYKRP